MPEFRLSVAEVLQNSRREELKTNSILISESAARVNGQLHEINTVADRRFTHQLLEEAREEMRRRLLEE
jgi:hypothetical protein